MNWSVVAVAAGFIGAHLLSSSPHLSFPAQASIFTPPMRIVNAGIQRNSTKYNGPFVELTTAPLAQKWGEGYGVAWFTDKGIYTAVSHYAIDSHSQLSANDNLYHGHITHMNPDGKCVDKFDPGGHAQKLGNNRVLLLQPEIQHVSRVMTFYATQKADKRFCVDQIFDDRRTTN